MQSPARQWLRRGTRKGPSREHGRGLALRAYPSLPGRSEAGRQAGTACELLARPWPSDPTGHTLSIVAEGTTHEKSGTASLTARSGLSATGTVERGLNDIRLAVLGLLVAVGLAAAAVPEAWLTQRAAGVRSFVFACFLVRWKRSRHLLMSFAHWLTEH